MDLLIRDNSQGKVYWAICSITFMEGSNYLEFEMSGTYYDPDYGYVVSSTEDPFRVYEGEKWPSEGILLVTGDAGVAGGNTKARLTALSSTTYQVEADTNGDGQYDWDSGTLLWNEGDGTTFLTFRKLKGGPARHDLKKRCQIPFSGII